MPTIYPGLPGTFDVSGLRFGGNGIGNCFFAYFHAVVVAKKSNGRIIAPTWWSVKIGPMLRREFSLRRYGSMFCAHPDEISGWRKVIRLASTWPGRERLFIPVRSTPREHGLTVVEAEVGSDCVFGFTFVGLHAHRAMIRQRLLDILVSPPRMTPKWGAGGYAAAHIRLGDFIPVSQEQLLDRDRLSEVVSAEQINKPLASDGLRIPLRWYAGAIRRLRVLYPDLPVYIFSDGREAELTEILTIEGVTLRREPSDIADLLALSQAEILIGSNSSFSRWATFLGNMPSIWIKSDVPVEQPSDDSTPILYVAEDYDTISHEALK
jgi:hypothetical protein